MEGLRKRDWLMAAALVPYAVVMVPIAACGTALILAYGYRPRRNTGPHRVGDHANQLVVRSGGRGLDRRLSA